MQNFVSGGKLISNGAVSLLMYAVQTVIGFFLIPIFIGKLGAETYGVWLLSGVLTGQLQFIDLGFTAGISRNIAGCLSRGDRRELGMTVFAGFVLLASVGVITSAILFFGTPLFLRMFHISAELHDSAAALLRVTSFCLLIEWPLKMLPTILQAGLMERYTSPLTTAYVILLNVLCIALISTGCVVWELRLAQLGCEIVLAAGLWLILRRKMAEASCFIIHDPRGLLRKIAPYSFGVFYASLLKYFAIGIDSFLLGVFLNPFAVAAYNVITKFFVVINLVTNKLLSSVSAAVMHLDALNDKTRMEHLMRKAIQIRTTLVFSVVFPTIIFMKPFVINWVGVDFEQYVIWGQIYLTVPLLACLGEGVGVMVSCGKLRLVNTVNTVSAGLNFLISIVLVGTAGVGGVIIGTVTAYMLLGDIVLFPIACCRLGFDARPVLKRFLVSLAGNAAAGVCIYTAVCRLPVPGWGALVAMGGGCFAFYAVLNSFLSLEREVRRELLSYGARICARDGLRES